MEGIMTSINKIASSSKNALMSTVKHSKIKKHPYAAFTPEELITKIEALEKMFLT